MATSLRRMYLLIHTPVHIGRPLQVGFVEKSNWSDNLFTKYEESVKRNHELGGSRTHLSKRDIERWGFNPPCGARMEVVEIELPVVEPLK